MVSRIIENTLVEEFKNKELFTREELVRFFRQFEPEMTAGTLGWRIHSLRRKNIIKTVKRGVYTIAKTPAFNPVFSEELQPLFQRIAEKYGELRYCIWDTAWLNEFVLQRAGRPMLIIEIEKQAVAPLYYYLKENSPYELFIDPKGKEIAFYVALSEYPVIVKRLIARSPLEKGVEDRMNVPIPALEKMLVDLFTEKKLFYFFKRREVANIFESALKKYGVNYTRMFSYAARREKEQEIKAFMMHNFEYLVKDIILGQAPPVPLIKRKWRKTK